MANAKQQDNGGKEVKVQKIVWAKGIDFHGKQRNETQGDAFGRYQRTVALHPPEGNPIVLQRDGAPTSAIPTFQRQLVKLCVAALMTPHTQKGWNYLDSLSLNLADAEGTSFMTKIADEGWNIEIAYGSGKRVTRLFTPVKAMLGTLASLSDIHAATVAKYPPEVAADAKEEEAVAVVEEVAIVL
jgi:hypothetical protein